VSLHGFMAVPDGPSDAFPVTQDLLEFVLEPLPRDLAHLRARAAGVRAPGTRFDLFRLRMDPCWQIGATGAALVGFGTDLAAE
jgi:hypothetical protein